MKKIASMLTIVAILTLALLSLTLPAYADKLDEIKAAGVLVVGTQIDFPPYEFYFPNPETGIEEPQGFEIQMARGLAESLGVELELRDQSFSGMLTALRNGEMDCVISGLSIKPDRQEVVDFSDVYFGGKQVLLSRTDIADSLTKPEDLAGMRLAAMTGSLQAGVAEEQFSSANIILMDRLALIVMDLRLGYLDGILLTDYVANTYVTLFPDELAITSVPVTYTGGKGCGVAVQKGDNETLLQAINEFLARVKSDGTFDKWVEDAIALNAQLIATEFE
ncbi:MAG: transporter substrate-binding domain-containing protein [Oscillospiraceae bacterium]|jgi:polar amino acid transport system substrate-binding protein|nr:transporter substrate-binding domain-containing protein [Oscillospiraceae bacterium]